MRSLNKPKLESLECPLTTDEFLERAMALAAVCQDIEREDGRQSQIKADMKAQLAKLEAEQSRLTLVVSRKAEPRDVRVQTYADDDRGVVVTIREDSGEVIRSRPMEMSERQLPLPESQPLCRHGVPFVGPCAACDAQAAELEAEHVRLMQVAAASSRKRQGGRDA